MKIDVYCVRDNLLGFGMPVLRDNDSVASRAFEEQIEMQPSYKLHPEHYDLYHIGNYDSDNGVITPCTPRFIASAKDFVRKDD